MTTPLQLPFPQTDRPYQTRPLSLRELRAGDIHSYRSPKEGRLVRVEGIANIAQALLMEFDPAITAFTERPRVLQVGTARYELNFWLRERSGRERMLLIVKPRDLEKGKGSRHAHRQAEALIEAAAAAYIPLEFVPELDLLAQRAKIAFAYRQLPSVQSAAELPNRGQIAERVLGVLEEFGRLRFAQLAAALGAYDAADLTCVLAALLHQGRVQCNAVDRILHTTTFELPP